MSDNENDKNNLIGVDPLAWLSDEEKQSVLNKAENSEILASGNEQKKMASTYTVNLSSALTIRDVSELMDELNAIDNACNEIVFETEQLERVDAAALQLLSAFYLSATSATKKVIWNRPGEALCHAVEVLGLSEVINIKSTAA